MNISNRTAFIVNQCIAEHQAKNSSKTTKSVIDKKQFPNENPDVRSGLQLNDLPIIETEAFPTDISLVNTVNLSDCTEYDIQFQNCTITNHPPADTVLCLSEENPAMENITDSLTLEPLFGNVTSDSVQPGCSNGYTVSCNKELPPVLYLRKTTNNYYVSPMHSGESDVDDLDADPDFIDKHTNNDSSSTESSSGVLNEIGEAEINKGKKRKRNFGNWSFQKTKLLRNSGQAYVSISKTKKQISERKLGPPCSEKCRLLCSQKINLENRENIFSGYWGLADIQKQREFIVRHTERIKPKYRYSCTENYRSMNSAFYFNVDGNRIRVCKTFFKATLNINDRPIRTALKKTNGEGFIIDDKRGKHGKQPQVNPEIKDSVRIFINAIPRIESHYLRAQTTREYIDSSKNLADLYRDYKEEREKQQLQYANYVMFNRIFNGEYNISFYVPKKDQCDLCASYTNADDESKKKMLNKYNLHIKEKKLSRLEKEADKINPNCSVVVYDLQAVMPVPRGQISSFYYKSKLNCYNFTISDLYAKNVNCYFWNETEGKRGATEIGSCVLRYLNQLVEENENGKSLDVIFYSDNCCGQQKNKYLVTAYSYAVNKLPIRSITHKYLITGHSQNEGDNVHSIIEKQIVKYLKSGPIYVPDEYSTLIRTAKKSSPPYKVHELTFEDFYDLKTLQEEWRKNFSIDTEKGKVNWNDIKILKVSKEHPDSFFYKISYEQVEFKRVDMNNAKKTRSQECNADSISLVQAYSKKFPLSDLKKNHLQELVDKNIIKKNIITLFLKMYLGFSLI